MTMKSVCDCLKFIDSMILCETNKLSKKVSNTNLDNNSLREHDLKRPQLTSNDQIEPDTSTKSLVNCISTKRNKNSLKADPYMRVLKLTMNI